MTKEELLDLAINAAACRIADYTPADLNALIKTLIVFKKEEVEPPVEVPRLKGFLEQNLISK